MLSARVGLCGPERVKGVFSSTKPFFYLRPAASSRPPPSLSAPASANIDAEGARAVVAVVAAKGDLSAVPEDARKKKKNEYNRIPVINQLNFTKQNKLRTVLVGGLGEIQICLLGLADHLGSRIAQPTKST